MYRILLVDDEEVILTGLKKLVDWEEMGISPPDCASNAAMALAMMEGRPYDILITDVRMPGMTGLDMIDRMHRLEYPTKVIVLSGYDDFEYLKTGFRYGIENYLLKPVEEEELTSSLLYTLDKIEKERQSHRLQQVIDTVVRDNVLNAWVTPGQDREALTEKLETFGIRLDRSHYLACVVRVRHPELLEETVTLHSRHVQGVFQQLCGEEENLYAAFTLPGDLLLIYAADQRPSPDSIPAFFEIAVERWLGGTGTGWCAAVGPMVENAMELSASFSTAMELLLYGSILPHSAVVASSLQEARIGSLLERLDLRRELLTELHALSEEDALPALVSLEERLPLLAALTPEEQEQSLADILYLIFIQSRTVQSGVWKNELTEPDFRRIWREEQLEDKIQALLELVLEHLRKHSQGSGFHPLVEQLMAIVREEYQGELSLKTLAAQLGVSQTYLGRIFKNDTGALFTEYLCNYRVDKARELLLTTQLKSSEIAKQTGFNNPNYFANVFRKRTGSYPTMFRQLHG